MEKNADRLMWSVAIMILALLMGGVVLKALPEFFGIFQDGTEKILDSGFKDTDGRSIAYLRFSIDGQPNNYPFGTEFIFKDVKLEKPEIRGTLSPGYKGLVPISGLTMGDQYFLEIKQNGYDFDTFRELDNITPRHEVVTITEKTIHDVKFATIGDIEVEQNPTSPDEPAKTLEMVYNRNIVSPYIEAIHPLKMPNNPLFLLFEVDSVVESNVADKDNAYNIIKNNIKFVDNLGRNHFITDVRYLGGEEDTQSQVNKKFNDMKVMDHNVSTVPDSFNVTLKQENSENEKEMTVYFAKVERDILKDKIPVVAPIYDSRGQFIANGTIEMEKDKERIMEGEYQMFLYRNKDDLGKDIVVSAPTGYKFVSGDDKIVISDYNMISGDKVARLKVPFVIPK